LGDEVAYGGGFLGSEQTRRWVKRSSLKG